MDTSITPANLEEDRGLIVRRSLLLYPGESSLVDYKSGVAFVKNDDFSLKLVKHILGMANAGGGYLVIGYPENASKHPEAGSMTDAILASYDVSTIAGTVEKYKSGTEKINIKVHKDKHPTNGQTYPIIEVGGFTSRPFFCKSSAGGILEENALYIRVAGARTIKVASPDEWDQLIDICVAKRQEETLRRFTDLMKEVGLSSSANSQQETVKKNLEGWINEERAQAKIEAEKAGFKFEGMEVFHTINSETAWNIKELLEAMKTSALRNTGWPIGFVFHVPEYKPQPYKKGLRSIIAPGTRESFDYWSISENGSFYFFRAYQEDSYAKDDEVTEKRQLWFDTQIWRITEALEHTTGLYKALGVDNTTKVDVGLNFLGIAHRSLRTSPSSSRLLFPHTSGAEDKYEWRKTGSIDVLSASIDQNVTEISTGLFLLFEFTEISSSIILEIIQDYRGIRKGV